MISSVICPLMNLPNALMELARNNELLAVRPRGVVVAMSPGLVVMRAGVPRPYPWQPRFADMIADDWIVGTLDKVRGVLGAQ